MTRCFRVWLLSISIGYAGGHIAAPWTSSAAAQETPRNSEGAPAAVRRIPPVPSPPVYPDPPLRVKHWSRADLERIYRARLDAARASGEPDTLPPNGPNFERQALRHYSFGANLRIKFDKPRPSNRSGVMSQVDDADQHEGVTDFYVYIGGNGQIVTGGDIENRIYGTNPRRAVALGSKVTAIIPGEFNGQPIRDGQTYDVKAGDWLAIPPGVPHWPGFNPGPDGLMYVMFKVNIGYYPDYLHF